jgi:hypothetical protein
MQLSNLFLLLILFACAGNETKPVQNSNGAEKLFRNDSCSQKVMRFLKVRTGSAQNLDSGLYLLSQRSSGIKLMTEQWQINEVNSNQEKKIIDFYRTDDGVFQILKPISQSPEISSLPEMINHPKDLLNISYKVTYREYAYQIGVYDVRLTSDGTKIITIERDKLFNCRLENNIYVCDCKKYF